MEFRCIEECSDCCVQREYYPNKQFGKIGVLILPDEKEKIEKSRPHYFGEDLFKATNWLTPIVWESINEVIVGAKEIMSFLKTVS